VPDKLKALLEMKRVVRPGGVAGYCVSLEPEARQRLQQRLQDILPRQADASIALKARACAIKALN